jgi:hypothetical protein
VICVLEDCLQSFQHRLKKGLWEQFFLTYEQVLMKNGYSQIEATSAAISIQGAREGEPERQETCGGTTTKIHLVDSPETRLILKSLG